MANFAMTPAAGSSTAFASLLQSEDQRYSALVKQIGFKPH
jgi:hypothetical protein